MSPLTLSRSSKTKSFSVLPDSYFCGTVPLERGLDLYGPASLESFQRGSDTSCLLKHGSIEDDAGGWADSMPF